MRTRLVGTAVAVTAALVPASAAIARPLDAEASKAKPVITLSGSTSVAPLASKLIKGYLKAKPGEVEFKLAQGGSDVGVADVARRPRHHRQLVARRQADRSRRARLQQDRA